jgi:hypothetical protein
MKKLIISSVLAATLSGCVAYPINNYGEPAYVAPAVITPVPVIVPGPYYAPGYYHHYHYYHR